MDSEYSPPFNGEYQCSIFGDLLPDIDALSFIPEPADFSSPFMPYSTYSELVSLFQTPDPDISQVDVCRSVYELEQKQKVEAGFAAQFQDPTHRLTLQLFRQANIHQYICNTSNYISAKSVCEEAIIILGKTHEFWTAYLDAGHSSDELIAAAIYISLIYCGIDLRRAMGKLKAGRDEELSDLQAFQRYVDIVEVLWTNNQRKHCSSNVGTNSKSSCCCVKNVRDFVIVCDELTNAISSKCEGNIQGYQLCSQIIVGIERSYLEECVNATFLIILMIINIFGRELIPESNQRYSNQKKKI
ncbi:MAG: hypothetical protein EZS28_015532 [Streblomastix strix]|uniref:Uncharacterized protein n=1 Tax=Streblomastix strix TaxID=222440 RepID=A0A5J4W2N5_9EUKA|nr:MAG: hypothetical protein EZS28_015532 [Streblomastix strix]